MNKTTETQPDKATAMTKQGGYQTAARVWINPSRLETEPVKSSIAAILGNDQKNAEANAALIVQAVNEHAALKQCEALVIRLDLICKRGGDIQRGIKGKEHDLQREIDSVLSNLAAIRKAGAK